MENKNTPAFPRIYQFGASQDNDFENIPGMTKREYFAAMAMQGFISNSIYFQGYSSNWDMARQSVQMAEALLSELEKPTP